MSVTLYMQTDKNIRVDHTDVFLKDVAALSCSDPTVLARMQALKICTIHEEQYGRYPVAVSDILKKIQKENPDVEVVHLGEPNFILTFENPRDKNRWHSAGKVIFVCLVTFFGTAFSIMTFNTDVDLPSLFHHVYESFTGMPYTGITILEISYSLGIGLGAIFFFNHFGKRKITQDPTPMEVEMRTYEDSVDTTIIEQQERKSQGQS
ncbi:MAG: stage V sporulation protein AA [Ruminococcus sp.]|jgi:stage V sporulation protein AA